MDPRNSCAHASTHRIGRLANSRPDPAPHPRSRQRAQPRHPVQGTRQPVVPHKDRPLSEPYLKDPGHESPQHPSRTHSRFLGAALHHPGNRSAAADDNGHGRPGKGVQLERLDRGLVAATTTEGVFLSWRLLGDEVTGPHRHRHDRPRLPRLPRRPADRDGHRQHQLPRPGRHRGRRVPGRRGRATARTGAQRAGHAVGGRATTTCRCASRPTASPRPARRTPTRPTT